MSRSLLADYPKDQRRYDEMFAQAGVARAQYQPLLKRLQAKTGMPLRDLFTETDRQIRDNGVTYNVYDDVQGTERPWTLDPLPLVLAADEWAQIEKGVVQRATLFNRILGDLYGPQELLSEGWLPPALILGHPGFLRPLHGMRPPGDTFLHLYAVDLARAPNGKWWVIGDRTQAPSGAGYALENRLIVSRLFPELFRDQRVRRLAQFFATLRDSLARMAPQGDGPTTTVVLTPGPYNETYFEHAYLARYLGFPLVEGQDLTVRDGCVWLKTLSGLRRVHAIIRRLDDDYCDPLELRSDSALGVPGLVEAARRGTVLLANALGVSLMESGALHGFLPSLCEHLLGEKLTLPTIATWWCGERAAMEDALEQARSLVFKSARAQHRFDPVFGEDLDDEGLEKLRARVRASPQDFVAQELVALSRSPVMDREHGGHLQARSVGLRVFAVATPEGYFVMPGGLGRTSSDNDVRILSSQRGGGSKDVWVCGDRAQLQLSLIHRPVNARDLVRSGSGLSSRVVENLFWFGRYSERCDNLARLLRVALGRLVDDVEDGSEWAGIAALCRNMKLMDGEEDEWEAPHQLVRAILDPALPGGLAAHVHSLSRVGFHLRERLSDDNWRTLNSMSPILERKPHHETGAFEALALLDNLITRLMTLAGFALDGMTRDHGWRFLSLGRRIERLQFQSRAISSAIEAGREFNFDNGLDWLLAVSDSSVTYHSRYIAEPEWLAVLDLLVADESNPRALVFQSDGLIGYLDRLGISLGRMPGEAFRTAHAALLDIDIERDLQPDSAVLAKLLAALYDSSAELSNALSQRFFSHVGSSRVSA